MWFTLCLSRPCYAISFAQNFSRCNLDAYTCSAVSLFSIPERLYI